tara:strand:- start:261 stop:719 length:459 start_codon:yes stop_codon:yes gene_type:complete
MTSRQLKSGFTFVEVLVALVIIAIGVAGIVGLQRLFMQSSTRAAQRITAMDIGQAKIEALRLVVFTELTPGFETITRQGNDYRTVWNIEHRYWSTGEWEDSVSVRQQGPLVPDAKLITVSVEWLEQGGGTASLRLETWFSRTRVRPNNTLFP